jgi:2-dehydropantoate 2-reductase
MNETIMPQPRSVTQSYAELQIEPTYPMGAYQPSTLVDWLAGRELEVEAIWGEPLRQAKKVELSLPHLEQLYQRLTKLQAGQEQTA